MVTCMCMVSYNGEFESWGGQSRNSPLRASHPPCGLPSEVPAASPLVLHGPLWHCGWPPFGADACRCIEGGGLLSSSPLSSLRAG